MTTLSLYRTILMMTTKKRIKKLLSIVIIERHSTQMEQQSDINYNFDEKL